MLKKIIFNLIYILLFVFFWISSCSVSYSKYLYNVSIDSIYINSLKLDDYYDIILSNKDSIKFNFTLEGFTQNSMYKVVLKNSQGVLDIKTTGVSNCLYANLDEDKYEILISAFDVIGEWITEPEIIKFEVDNNKANLIAVNRQLSKEKRTSDSLITLSKNRELPSLHNSNLWGMSFLLKVISGIVIIIIIVLIILLVRLYRRNKIISKKILEFQTQIAIKDKMLLDSQNVRTDDLVRLKQTLEWTMTEINSKVDEIMYLNETILCQVDLMRHKDFELRKLQENKNEVFSDILARGVKEPAVSIKSLVKLLRSYDLNVNNTKNIVQDIIEATQKIIAISEDIQKTFDVNITK